MNAKKTVVIGLLGTVLDAKAKKITVDAADEFKAEQVYDVLFTRLAKRGLSLKCFKKGEVKAYMDPSARVLDVYTTGDVTLPKAATSPVPPVPIQSLMSSPVPIHSPPLGAVYANPHTMEQM